MTKPSLTKYQVIKNICESKRTILYNCQNFVLSTVSQVPTKSLHFNDGITQIGKCTYLYLKIYVINLTLFKTKIILPPFHELFHENFYINEYRQEFFEQKTRTSKSNLVYSNQRQCKLNENQLVFKHEQQSMNP